MVECTKGERRLCWADCLGDFPPVSTIYVNGEIDTVSYLFALDRSGKFLWKSPIGKEWTLNYPGSRNTPTIVNDLVYVTTGLGTVACMEAKTGIKRWSVNMVTDFHAVSSKTSCTITGSRRKNRVIRADSLQKIIDVLQEHKMELLKEGDVIQV